MMGDNRDNSRDSRYDGGDDSGRQRGGQGGTHLMNWDFGHVRWRRIGRDRLMARVSCGQ
jgi:hypothetical protein